MTKAAAARPSPIAVTFAVLSYAGTVTISLIADPDPDPDAVPDLPCLTNALRGQVAATAPPNVTSP
ncbi:WS/DGAT domain-containing protein [Nonomuraea sp. NPDC049750]|uniref:WS/DGAT domain-containing protein n=1 Tax=Nonomuraea sp. NPDC049750 TaxID=3154738 RepID=UPI0033F73D7C